MQGQQRSLNATASGGKLNGRREGGGTDLDLGNGLFLQYR